jgi:outer membrane murein-binding lipoprotein Lpp
MKALFAAILATVALAGCAVQAQMVPTGGSRSDGSVKMSYDFGAFQVPKVNASQGLAAAKARCAAWGYSGAEPFGGGTRSCISASMGSCDAFRVTVEYQCTGNPPPRS